MIRIGTRDSQLAQWQAQWVKDLLLTSGVESTLVYIKSDGDLNLHTPLYEMGVRGIFTRSLDVALLERRIDLAVHSLKDVPTTLAKGIAQAAVLKRGPYKDVFVFKESARISDWNLSSTDAPLQSSSEGTIATSSVRRRAQWLRRYPRHLIDDLRGNVNTRLRKLSEQDWDGAIFAQAGLKRIGLRPEQTIELDWMLPAPGQGAVVAVCRADDQRVLEACVSLNDPQTFLCTGIERAFLRTLLGGCATPISALATIENEHITFRGNILSPDGSRHAPVELYAPVSEATTLGQKAADILLQQGGRQILETFSHAKTTNTDPVYQETD